MMLSHLIQSSPLSSCCHTNTSLLIDDDTSSKNNEIKNKNNIRLITNTMQMKMTTRTITTSPFHQQYQYQYQQRRHRRNPLNISQLVLSVSVSVLMLLQIVAPKISSNLLALSMSSLSSLELPFVVSAAADSVVVTKEQEQQCSCPPDSTSHKSDDNYNNNNINNSNDRYYYYTKQIEQLEKEVGTCQAVTMAIETREGVMKQQLHDTQQQLQILQQQQQQQQRELTSTTPSDGIVSSSSQDNLQQQQQRIDDLVYEVSIQKQRIMELEMQLIDTNPSSLQSSTSSSSSSSSSSQQKQPQQQTSSTTTSTSLAACQHTLSETLQRVVKNEIQYQDQIDVLHMKLEEFHENELRIDELSQQIQNDKLIRTNMKEEHMITIATYEERIRLYEQQIQEMELNKNHSIYELQQQLSDTVTQCNARIEDMVHTNEELLTMRIQQVLDDTTSDCNRRIVDIQQQHDNKTQNLYHQHNLVLQQSMVNVTNECHDRITKIQQQYENEIRLLNDEHDDQINQLLEATTNQYNDRIISLQQQLNDTMKHSEQVMEYQQQLRNIGLALQNEQQLRSNEQMAQQQYKQMVQKHYQHVYELYNVCQHQHKFDTERIKQVQDELYTLRYTIHNTNERNRHKTIIQILLKQFNVYVLQPCTRYMYHSLWMPIVYPYFVLPIQSYIQQYSPLCVHYMKLLITKLRIVYDSILLFVYKTLYQQYVIPSIQYVHNDILNVYYPVMIENIMYIQAWIVQVVNEYYSYIVLKMNDIYQQYLDPIIVLYTPIVLDQWNQLEVILRHYFTVIQISTNPYTQPIWEYVQSTYNTIYDVIYPYITTLIDNMDRYLGNNYMDSIKSVTAILHPYYDNIRTTIPPVFIIGIVILSVLLYIIIHRRKQQNVLK